MASMCQVRQGLQGKEFPNKPKENKCVDTGKCISLHTAPPNSIWGELGGCSWEGNIPSHLMALVSHICDGAVDYLD